MIALTIALILITTTTSIIAFSRVDLYNRWIFNAYQVSYNKQYWRFISSGFIHANYFHLVLNMVALYFFGKTVEFHLTFEHGFLGKIYFLTTYMGGIMVAELPSFFKNRNLPHYYSLGASGGVSAVLFGSILYKPLAPLFKIDFLPAFLLGALYLLYSYFQGKMIKDNVNHRAHLYGAIFGIIFTIAINPKVAVGFYNQISNFRLF